MMMIVMVPKNETGKTVCGFVEADPGGEIWRGGRQEERHGGAATVKRENEEVIRQVMDLSMMKEEGTVGEIREGTEAGKEGGGE